MPIVPVLESPVSALRWPDAVAFREAIQHPEYSIGDPELARCIVALDRQGLPLSYTGRFAVVFPLVDPEGDRWALRCFTTPGDALRAARYGAIARRLGELPDLFVPFRFLARGVRVGGLFFPAVAMPWAEGTPLGRWVETHRHDPAALRRLARTLGEALARMEAAGIAHGDWQHDNLLVSDDGARVTLVDYDAVFVPELSGYPSPELGHPNYQHPQRQAVHFGVGLDRFPCLVLQGALLALARQPSLWERYGGGESVLFRRDDFLSPGDSPLVAELCALAELDGDEELAASLARLIDACERGDGAYWLPAIANHPPRTLPSPARPAEFLDWTPDNAEVAWLQFAARREDLVFALAERRYRQRVLQWQAGAFFLPLFLFVLLVLGIVTVGQHQDERWLSATVVALQWWMFFPSLLTSVVVARRLYPQWPTLQLVAELDGELNGRRKARFALFNELLLTRDRRQAAAVRERMRALDRAIGALEGERAKLPDTSWKGFRRWLQAG